MKKWRKYEVASVIKKCPVRVQSGQRYMDMKDEYALKQD